MTKNEQSLVTKSLKHLDGPRKTSCSVKMQSLETFMRKANLSKVNHPTVTFLTLITLIQKTNSVVFSEEYLSVLQNPEKK